MKEKQLTKYERKQIKREERKKNEHRTENMKKLKRLSLLGIAILLIGGAGYGVSRISSQRPPVQDFSVEVPFEGEAHVSEGTPVDYRSNPPTSGDHWSEPLKDGLYDTEKPDEAAIHSLEHGRVWVSYKPSIPTDTITALEELLSDEKGVILTPRSKNDTDISLSAWMHLDTFNLNEDGSLDENRILNFIKKYRGKGPEAVPMTNDEGKEY